VGVISCTLSKLFNFVHAEVQVRKLTEENSGYIPWGRVGGRRGMGVGGEPPFCYFKQPRYIIWVAFSFNSIVHRLVIKPGSITDK